MRSRCAGGPLRTAADGSFRTPDNLLVGSAYRVVVRGAGQGADPLRLDDDRRTPRALLPMRLRALRSVGGRVVDRQGKPVASVEVFQAGDGPEQTSTRSVSDGRFALGGFRQGPVFLFARGDGFRFHGQLIREGEGEVVGRADADRRAAGAGDADAPRADPAGGVAGDGAAAGRAGLEGCRERGKRSEPRSDTSRALAIADPAGTLEKLESARFAGKLWESRVRSRDRPGDGRHRPRGRRGGGRVDRRPGLSGRGLDRTWSISCLPLGATRSSSPCSIAPPPRPGPYLTRPAAPAIG